MTYRAICFDMDGVLIDSEDFWIEREREELLPAVVAEDVPVREITGLNYREIFAYLDAEYTTTVSEAEFVDVFETVAQEIYTRDAALMPDVRDLLATIRDRGCATAIVSASPQAWIGLVVDRFDLHEHFDAVVSAEDVDEPGKPEPHVYLHATETLGVEPDEAIAVEDSEHGLASAVAAGLTTIGYRTPVNQGADLSPADVVVEGPAELRRALLKQIE